MTRSHRFPHAAAWIGALFALLVAACAQPPAYQVYEQPVARTGTVESVQQVVAQPENSGLGMIAGALAGGGLGSLIGGGTGRTVATVVGAIGGGYVGNELEKNRTQMLWQVSVRYDDGSYASIRQADYPGVRPGDRVRVTGTGLELLPR